eukprot:891000-Pyramimonas_sp.AAC.1
MRWTHGVQAPRSIPRDGAGRDERKSSALLVLLGRAGQPSDAGRSKITTCRHDVLYSIFAQSHHHHTTTSSPSSFIIACMCAPSFHLDSLAGGRDPHSQTLQAGQAGEIVEPARERRVHRPLRPAP